MRWAVLLKGVNVGGNRKIPMADLRDFLTGLGLTDVKTLLASGNAVFDTDEKDAAKLEARLEQEAKAKLCLDTGWLLRSHADLVAVVKANPFPEAAKEHPHHLLVHFHRESFPQALLDAFIHDGPERVAAEGRELFVDYPDDVGHSKLPQSMSKAKFPKLATARNWNTVLKLVELTK
jgi:uncharacterized protein (DUF1697 family)